MHSTCPTDLRLLDLIAPTTFGNENTDYKTIHYVILPHKHSTPRSASPQPIPTVAAQVVQTQKRMAVTRSLIVTFQQGLG
jgi:hypothetical protein